MGGLERPGLLKKQLGSRLLRAAPTIVTVVSYPVWLEALVL